MKKILSNRNVSIINLLIIGFFSSIYLIDLYKVDAVLIGVFRELFTLPFLGALLFFSVLGVVYFFTSKTKTFLRSISSIIVIGILSFIIIGFITFWKF
jgi:hypothetical protein